MLLRSLARILTLVALALFLLAPEAGAVQMTLDFEGLANGEIVDVDFLASHGVTISADNTDPTGADIAIIFDSLTPSGADPDLNGPVWAGGNLAPGTVLGNLLIIPENDSTCVGDICANPDDEGGAPMSSFTFDFETGITNFGLDIVDHDEDESGFLTFWSGGAWVGIVSFTALGLDLGDNTANRIDPFEASDFGVDFFDKVVVVTGGSLAIDNVTFDQPNGAPEPGTLLLLSSGLIGLALHGRRRRSH